MAQGMDQWRAFVNAVMPGFTTGDLSISAQLHKASYIVSWSFS
jgi:hypothetical protein